MAFDDGDGDDDLAIIFVQMKIIEYRPKIKITKMPIDVSKLYATSVQMTFRLKLN